MTDLTGIKVVCTAENALKKLKKEGICVYNCKKDGAFFIFFVKDKDVEKVFTIFDKPCYNIRVHKKSKLKRALSLFALRAGLIAGAFAFCVLAALSDSYILKIEVSGSGSYLYPEVRRIVSDEGAKEFGRYSQFNQSTATGKILALPQVTFCNISKKGSVLLVDVQVDAEHYGSLETKPLLSDADGTVRKIVAICGTAAVSVGDAVKRGDALINAYNKDGEKTESCIAVGYAEIECRRTFEYFAESESEESLKDAFSSLLLEDENITERKYSVKPTDGGVLYVIDCVFLHKVSINLT